MKHNSLTLLLAAAGLLAGVQTARAQKVVLHMAGNQKAEYDVSQLDSINFVEVDSSGENPSTDPSVTGDAIDITNKSATLIGYATSIRENLANDLRVGFIYCLEGTPNKNNGTQITVNKNDVAEDGRYMATIENLLSNATYYFRSFVYQSGLWFYGKVKSFVTTGVDMNFTTGDAADITCYSAKVSGSFDTQSIYTSLAYGICYGTNIEPTTNDKTQTASSNNFTLQLRQLTGGTTYYYRPYAIVDGQTYYGNVQTFRTLDDNVVETGTIDEETLTVTSHLTIGGGAYNSLVLGVCYCYGQTELPTIYNKTVTSDEVDEENNYTIHLVNPGGSTIFYRAYVLIDGIPHYGTTKSFEMNYEWVDLGLPSGTLWATCNVGANNPEEYGDYFAWGETKPKSDYNYNFSTYLYCMGSNITLTKYCTDSSCGYNDFTDGQTELLPEDDAATANWGANWQMPSRIQFQELLNSYTTVTGMTKNGVYGRKITSKSNGNSIFLPAAGYWSGTNLCNVGNYGSYWSRSLSTSYSYYAYILNLSFFSGSLECRQDFRDCGRTIRPVRVKR